MAGKSNARAFDDTRHSDAGEPPHTTDEAALAASAAEADAILSRTATAPTPKLPLLDVDAPRSSRWFAIQLELSDRPIDPEQVPNLEIFKEYQLYSLTGLYQSRVTHALRLGFFSSEVAASAVAGYLQSFFPSTAAVRRVSLAERERFAEKAVAACKDIGETGSHATIELAAPAPLPQPKPTSSAPAKAARQPARPGAASIWSRLLTPLKR